jgi:transcription initiation factor TFIIE subunit alpha
MQKYILENQFVLEYLNTVIGNQKNIPIIECLLCDMGNDEEIAEKTNIKLNTVRNVLYKLYDSGLATYKRNKDPETQWFTYTWKFDRDIISLKLNEKYEENINELNELLIFEQENLFFVCENEHIIYDKLRRVEYTTAAELEFICPECGNKIDYEDNTKKIERIEKEIEQYKESYTKVNNFFIKIKKSEKKTPEKITKTEKKTPEKITKIPKKITKTRKKTTKTEKKTSEKTTKTEKKTSEKTTKTEKKTLEKITKTEKKTPEKITKIPKKTTKTRKKTTKTEKKTPEKTTKTRKKKTTKRTKKRR